MIILNRIHKEKGKKKKVLMFSQTSKAARDHVSPAQLPGAEGRSAATKPLRFSASCFKSIIARPENTFCHQLPGKPVLPSEG